MLFYNLKFFIMQERKLTIEEAIEPIVRRGIAFSEQRLLLNTMFATTVANAPDDESDNFTARRLQPFYLALSELLENLENIEDVNEGNQLCLMDKIIKC